MLRPVAPALMKKIRGTNHAKLSNMHNFGCSSTSTVARARRSPHGACVHSDAGFFAVRAVRVDDLPAEHFVSGRVVERRKSAGTRSQL